MKKFNPLLFSGVLLASGAISNNQDGVNPINQDGTIYLDKSLSATSTSSAVTYQLLGHDVQVPAAFFSDIGQLLNKILMVVIALSALLVLMHLIWGAIDWITSGGDKAKIDKAKNKIVAAIIGLIIVASSYAVLTIVLNFLGVKSLQDVLNSVTVTQL